LSLNTCLATSFASLQQSLSATMITRDKDIEKNNALVIDI
jgi:hypothetical protein